MGFSLFYSDPDDLKLLQVCQFAYGGLHKVLTLPAIVLLATTNYVMFNFKKYISALHELYSIEAIYFK